MNDTAFGIGQITIWTDHYLDRALFGQSTIWTDHYLDRSLFGQITIWTDHYLDRSLFGQITIWTDHYLDVRNCVGIFSGPAGPIQIGDTTLLAIFVFCRRRHNHPLCGAGGGGGGVSEFARQYLRAEVWWHPSARADYAVYLVNAALVPVVFAPFFAVSLIVAKQVRDLLGTTSTMAEMPDGWLILAYSLVIFGNYPGLIGPSVCM